MIMESKELNIFLNDTLHLPNEILENIFAQLPLSAMLTTYTRICKSWTDVILNPFFLPWKKFYLSLKLERQSPMSTLLLDRTKYEELLPADDIMKTLFERHNLTNLRSFFPNLIRFMGNIHKGPKSFEFCSSLKHHRLHKSSSEFLKWAPDELIGSGPYNVWHFATVVIILAEDVWDIYSLIELLLSLPNFIATDVIEALYSLASLFLYAARKLDLPIRYHYVLYYSLYLYENSWQPFNESKSHLDHSGQQSMLKYVSSKQEKIPTHEQAKIISHNIQKSHVVKIVAFAGTGKTTTLLRYCKERPHLRFLLVVYNKSVQEYCNNMFPSNTVVKTAHALAFGNVGRRYAAIRKLDGSLKPMKISEILEEKKNSGNRFKRAGLVKVALENFINSASPNLTLHHVPEKDKHGVRMSDDFRLKVILDDAEKVWKEMKRCSSSQRINMSQDGQLKVWQLNKPKLLGYDVVMIDEGQDMNPTMFDIFLNQDAAKIIVGDPYQQIYSFRGATNAIQSIDATHTFYLTQSFRFGPEISFIGQNILENLLQVPKKTLVGGNKKDTILHSPNDWDGMQRAYLCRTNSYLYILALQLCKSSKLNNKTIAFNGGLDKFALEDILDIMKLVKRSSKSTENKEAINITNKFIAKFKNYETLVSYAENVEDKELLGKIAMYKYSGVNTASDVNLIRNRCVGSVMFADIVLSTIHKAKGLEWDWVIMADDMITEGFKALFRCDRESIKGEINLLYVAATRAKKRLTINTAVLHSLYIGREKLERLTLSSEMDMKTKCVQCGNIFVEEGQKLQSPLVAKLPELPLSSSNYQFAGGYICYACSESKCFELPEGPRGIGHGLGRIRFKANERIARLCLLNGTVVEPPH